MFSDFQIAPPEAMPARSLKARGRCCKNSCIHCPFGHTLKQHGLKFLKLEEKNLSRIQKLTAGSIDFTQFPLSDYQIVLLKGFICAVVRVDKLFVKEFYLMPDFVDQGLSKEVIESYYFC
jgi:hypothetical protein